MSSQEELPVVKEQKKRKPGRPSSNTTEIQAILLRMPSAYATTLRAVAEQEKRTMTAVMTRAMQLYLKQEHDIDLVD
jgi:hypothetical protein